MRIALAVASVLVATTGPVHAQDCRSAEAIDLVRAMYEWDTRGQDLIDTDSLGVHVNRELWRSLTEHRMRSLVNAANIYYDCHILKLSTVTPEIRLYEYPVAGSFRDRATGRFRFQVFRRQLAERHGDGRLRSACRNPVTMAPTGHPCPSVHRTRRSVTTLSTSRHGGRS